MTYLDKECSIQRSDVHYGIAAEILFKFNITKKMIYFKESSIQILVVHFRKTIWK